MTIHEFLSRFPEARQEGNHWIVRCPSHDDDRPSLTATQGRDGRILIHCFGGCRPQAVLRALGLQMRDLFPAPPAQGCTLQQLADYKHLPLEALQEFGLTDITYQNHPAVRISYRDTEGVEKMVQIRRALLGDSRLVWRAGTRVNCLYGLDRLRSALESQAQEPEDLRYIWPLEGPSDCWTMWFHGYHAAGLPSASSWREEWVVYFEPFAVILIAIEPDTGGESVKRWLATSALREKARLVEFPPNAKDPSELYLSDPDHFDHRLEELLERSWDWMEREADARAVEVERLRLEAGPVLEAADPLALVREEIQRLGYGGDIHPAVITYLAMTTRLLGFHPGAMPSHTNIIGAPSAGKSWTMKVVLRTLPESAYHVIDASSPRVFIFDRASLKHRALIFGEADNLPTSEASAALSAMRNLLQDGYLHYQVVLPNPATGQMDSRVFTLEVVDHPDQTRAALATLARLELGGDITPEPTLIAFQRLLQEMAPWQAVVPFADRLSRQIGEREIAPRITRDYTRLLALIKAVTVVRHMHRERDASGRLIATLEDYATVRDLVISMFQAAATEASPKVRETVAAATDLLAHRSESVSLTDLATKLGLSVPTARQRAYQAIKKGFLVNEETKRYHPAKLKLGEPLPEERVLPSVEDLVAGDS